MSSVRSERNGGIATLTIDREAKRNALDRATLDALEAALVAVAADFTVASENARFGLPEIGIGLLPLMVSAPIYRALGSRKALLDLVLTGRQIDAAEAMRLGLVSRVVTASELDAEIARLAATLLSHSPATLRLGKEAVYTLCEMEYETSMRYLREMIVLTSRSEDAQEGIQAFFDKRKPVWKGR